MRAWLRFLPILPVVAACDSGTVTPPPPPAEVHAKGISITDVDLFQVVDVPLFRGGADATPSVPVIRGKDAVIRVSFSVDADFAPRELFARLTIDGAEPIEASLLVSSATDPLVWATGFTLPVPGDLLVAGATASVELFEADPKAKVTGTEGVTTWPAAGAAALPIEDVGDATHLVLVPIRYNPDGSGRLPDTTPEQIERYRARFEAIYPVASVALEVAEPWDWDGPPVQPFGQGWAELLSAFAADMHGGASDPTAYYFGLFEPAGSFGAFCGGGCVAGLSFSSDQPSFAEARSSIGLGYPGPDSADTMMHELGHAHGLAHAPCGGADAPDPAFPYDGGGIGVAGYDVEADAFKDPDLFNDMMGYCPSPWISDYNYLELFERTKALAPAMSVVPGAPRAYRVFAVGGDGSLTLVRRAVRDRPVGGAERLVRVRGADGAVLADVTGYFLAADHLPGGMLLVPEVEGADTEELL